MPSLTIVTADKPAATLALIARLTPAVLPAAIEGSCGMVIVDAVVMFVIEPISASASVAADVAVAKVSSKRWALCEARCVFSEIVVISNVGSFDLIFSGAKISAPL